MHDVLGVKNSHLQCRMFPDEVLKWEATLPKQNVLEVEEMIKL